MYWSLLQRERPSLQRRYQTIETVACEQVNPVPLPQSLRDLAIFQARGDQEYGLIALLLGGVKRIFDFTLNVPGSGDRSSRQTHQHCIAPVDDRGNFLFPELPREKTHFVQPNVDSFSL